MNNLSDLHYAFIKERHGKLKGNIGWVAEENSICSKLPEEYIETKRDSSSKITHTVTPRK